MIKATVEETRIAYAALTRIFDETKLTGDVLWNVSRLLGKMKGTVKDFERAQLKLYKDAGGVQDARGIQIELLNRGANEDDAAWSKRREEYRDKSNRLYEDIDDLLQNEVEFELKPVSYAALPKERKNDKGEKEPVEYRATDIANAGPFIVDAATKE